MGADSCVGDSRLPAVYAVGTRLLCWNDRRMRPFGRGVHDGPIYRDEAGSDRRLVGGNSDGVPVAGGIGGQRARARLSACG